MRGAALLERHLDARELAAGRFDADVERRGLADEALRPADVDGRALRAAGPPPRPGRDHDEHDEQKQKFSHDFSLKLPSHEC
jgi:hypothetical protein